MSILIFVSFIVCVQWIETKRSSWVSSLVNRLMSPSRMKGVLGTCSSSLLTCIAVCMPDIGFPLHGVSVIVKSPLWPLTAFLCVTWDKKKKHPRPSFRCYSSRCFVSFSLSWAFSALSFETLPLVCIIYRWGNTISLRILVYRHGKRLFFLFFFFFPFFFDKTKMKQYLLLIILFYTIEYNWSCDSRL